MQKFLLSLLLTVFCSGSVVAEEAAASQGGMLSSMVLFSSIFVMFYFMMIRPQSKKQKEHRDLLGRLAAGDEVVTTGGIVGKIAKVTDNFYLLNISDGVEVLIQKNAIAVALPKGTIKAG